MTRSIRLAVRRLTALRDGQRLATAIVMMIAIAGVLTGVSWTRTSRLASELDRIEEVALPTVRAAHALALMVDEARGLEALLLLTDEANERQEITQRLARQRSRIRDRLTLQLPRAQDDADRRHLESIVAAADAWWRVQDDVVAASRKAWDDRDHARAARALVAGDSQRAYRRVVDELEAWWRHHDDLATWATRKARGRLLLPAQAALAGAACFAGGAMLLAWLGASRMRGGIRPAMRARRSARRGGTHRRLIRAERLKARRDALRSLEPGAKRLPVADAGALQPGEAAHQRAARLLLAGLLRSGVRAEAKAAAPAAPPTAPAEADAAPRVTERD